MRKTVLNLTIGIAASCALAVLTAVNAAELPLDQFDDFGLDIIAEGDSDSNSDTSLTVPETAEPKAKPAPAKELSLAQTPAPAGAPAAADAGAADGDLISNILEEPALNAPAPITKAPAAVTPQTVKEPVIPQLPPAGKSIVKTPETTEPLPPAVTIDPTVETAAPFDQPVTQPLAGNNLVARGPAPILNRSSCPTCPQGIGSGFSGPVTNRPVYYGVQRNGLPAYPRAGNCCGCGGCGCPGCCGRRAPMPYPYYTLRGPRDFDDPNPRPIGP